MDAFLFHLDGKFPLGEGIHVGKVLLKQLPMFQNVEGQVGQAQVADGLQFLVMLFLQDAERGLGVSQEKNTGIERHILRRLFLPADDDSRADDGLRGHAVRVGVLLGLAATAPKTFEESNLAHIEVVLVFVKNNQGVDRLRYPVVHGRNGGHTHVGRFHVMEEEGLQAGGQRGLTGTFLTEQVQDGEMPGAFIDHVPEEGGN